MRPLPRNIRLLGQVIPVIDRLNLEHEGGKCHGLYEPSAPRISIDRVDGHERKRATLVHESLHAMFNAAALSAAPADDEEELVSRLAPILLSWIRENRLMIEYLRETSA